MRICLYIKYIQTDYSIIGILSSQAIFKRRLSSNIDTEVEYEPTELEIIGFIWFIKRIYYIIKAAKYRNPIFTDYITNIFIIERIILTSINRNKLILKFFKVSVHLLSVSLKIKYRFRGDCVILEILLRMSSDSGIEKL